MGIYGDLQQDTFLESHKRQRSFQDKEAVSPYEKNSENLLDRKVGKLFQAKGTASTKAQEHLTSSKTKSPSS